MGGLGNTLKWVQVITGRVDLPKLINIVGLGWTRKHLLVQNFLEFQ